jgi:cyclopropane fatty-acyl-phospholipid synthase-like methyltransferase
VNTRKLAELCDRLPAHAHVLDLGCGAGVPVMQQLVARDAAVIGIDASAAQIESADVMYPKSSSSRPI